jgi:hypothetical protein
VEGGCGVSRGWGDRIVKLAEVGEMEVVELAEVGETVVVS